MEIAGDTRTNFQVFCPLHGNTVTPSMSISKTSGAFICFNPACDARGGIESLIRDVTKSNDYEIARLLAKTSTGTISSVERVRRHRSNAPFPTVPDGMVERLHEDLMNSPVPLEYMEGRGFNEETLVQYQVGYSASKNMISTPMFDIEGSPVGFIGRGIEKKVFRNSIDLPTGRTLWNIHNARRFDTIVLVEANFDAMRVSQAGFPNVVACLGGNFSDEHAEQLERNATFIVVMTDYDDHREHMIENCRRCRDRGLSFCRGHNPGRVLGNKIAEKMRQRGKVVRWAVYNDEEVFPNGAKDPGDMTDREIQQCIENAESNFAYQRRMKDSVV